MRNSSTLYRYRLHDIGHPRRWMWARMDGLIRARVILSIRNSGSEGIGSSKSIDPFTPTLPLRSFTTGPPLTRPRLTYARALNSGKAFQ